MFFALMLVSEPVAPLNRGEGTGNFDLKAVTARNEAQLSPVRQQQCAPGNPNEIVVCGSRQESERYRLRPLPDGEFEEDRLVAEADLGGGFTGKMHMDQVEISPGLVSKRVLFSIKKPF
ncbi:MAG: hypothetical protein M3Q08_10640 [Pseudomonadota bacterium]|nr:hypothetical protein [Pseudomonadota bacterium]